jgi:hypothetical protein
MPALTSSEDPAVLPPQLARTTGVMRIVTATVCGFLASCILLNENSYVIAAVLVVLALRPRFERPTRYRVLVLLITGVLVVFGTINGYGAGHSLDHISRFALPLTVFFLFVLTPGMGLLVARSTEFMIVATFALTLLFFHTVMTSNWLRADDIMAGWTLTYSSNAAISVWHYFVLPVCAVAIAGAFAKPMEFNSLVLLGIAILTLTMLIVLNETSSFLLAVGLVLTIWIIPRRLSRLAFVPVLALLGIYMLDFLTLKILSRWVVDQVQGAGIEDIGDALRIIQIEYFVERAEFLGSGFGARHDFPFMISVARQLAQVEFPYASELPILNILYNGGILAALWFLAVIWTFFWLLTAKFERGSAESHYRQFGLACAGVLVGSLSNPYLFAPASMLLLAMMVDLTDYLQQVQKARRAASASVNNPAEIAPQRHYPHLAPVRTSST